MSDNLQHSLFLSKNMIFSGVDFPTRDEILNYLASQFVRQDLVKESYPAAIIEREKEFPTALAAKAFDIAIPHCASANVNVTSMAVATLAHPVGWYAMDDPTRELYPHIVFMLAIKDPKKQLEILQKIMSIIQNTELLTGIQEASSREEIFVLLDPVINR